MLAQQSTVMPWSSITGTRPGVLLPQLLAAQSTSSAKSVDGTLSQGQDPPTTSTTRGWKRNEAFKSDLLKYAFIHDTPKTVLWGRDMLCAIINFINLKGRAEGTDGTRFFMHRNYQLTFCPILHIITMAFRDNALPLRWKKDKLKLPVLRRIKQPPYGVKVDPTLPMTYDSSNLALKHTREGHFAEAERRGALGQLESVVFEKHY
ncbi:uncharacterized protein K441DRAFT_707124 [Cenococcum geophilum 1.58]|uniref:uncharacterized protein n=1 Tax=Cenococcum geophilum 1.58 TaxID=794803 RepID=UPI00358E652E|nr:hypothetical protein K441DRAFT_707124 [Cenococcum geophilum 1.58]